MKYFVFDFERCGTCYHEFYKGKWDGHTFWKKDSIFISDDILIENPDFVNAITAVVANYDCFGETEITPLEWNKIGEIIKYKSIISQEIYLEADKWLKSVFQEHSCFTILGI